jgi:predicted RNA methylase
VGEEDNGLRSLRALLHLLASAAAGSENPLTSNLAQWGLSKAVGESLALMSAATWQPLYNDLCGLGRYDAYPPDFDLVIRHASGAVFQDAHLEAQISRTRWLEGLEGPAFIDPRTVPNETGIYFTPAALARTLAEEAVRDAPIDGRPLTLFDPACGSGELLKECLRQLRQRAGIGRVRVIGWDKSVAAVDMARFVLSWESRAWLADQVEITVEQHDSITDGYWPTDVDILIMNPPFKAWSLMTMQERDAVTQILGASYRPNLAMAFARRALTALSANGVLAMIAPNSLLESESGRDTRTEISEYLDPRLVARLGDQSYFARALVDAGLYVGKRKSTSSPRKPAAVLWADSRQNSVNYALRGLRRWRGAEVEPIKGDGFWVYLRNDVAINGDPWIARGYDAWVRFKSVQRGTRLRPASEVFHIRQGSRLGNDVFVVSRKYVQSLTKREQLLFRPAVMNPSVIDGKVNADCYVFYPYTEGLPAIVSEEQLKSSVPKYYEDRLRPAKKALSSLSQSNRNWWDLLRPRSWQHPRAIKIVSKYFGGSRAFAFDATGDFVVVVGYAWLLRRGAVARGITSKEIYLATLAYLNSGVAHDLIEYMSPQVAGGQLDLSSKYLNNLPVPDLAQVPPARLAELIQIGKKITEEERFDRWADVDDIVLSALGG